LVDHGHCSPLHELADSRPPLDKLKNREAEGMAEMLRCAMKVYPALCAALTMPDRAHFVNSGVAACGYV
jgi:hypothetical protein